MEMPVACQLTPSRGMDSASTQQISSCFTDVVGLRTSGIFPPGKEPSIRTLREWTKLRRIPYHKIGHLVYFDPKEVELHIRTRLRIPARGESEAASIGARRHFR
jgi:hypothetical protein